MMLSLFICVLVRSQSVLMLRVSFYINVLQNLSSNHDQKQKNIGRGKERYIYAWLRTHQLFQNYHVHHPLFIAICVSPAGFLSPSCSNCSSSPSQDAKLAVCGQGMRGTVFANRWKPVIFTLQCSVIVEFAFQIAAIPKLRKLSTVSLVHASFDNFRSNAQRFSSEIRFVRRQSRTMSQRLRAMVLLNDGLDTLALQVHFCGILQERLPNHKSPRPLLCLCLSSVAYKLTMAIAIFQIFATYQPRYFRIKYRNQPSVASFFVLK